MKSKRIRRVGVMAVGCLSIAGTSLASAQRAPASSSVSGTVFDSLRSKPLDHAFVAIAGTSRSTQTDARGRFRFDSVAPGAYTFTAQHDALDSAGFSGIAAKAVLKPGAEAEVRLATPSFSTLWRLVCGERPESPDSGFVFGTIRNAIGGKPARDATVELSWIDLAADKQQGVTQKRFRADTRSDQNGGYGVCGVPVTSNVRARASLESAASGLIDLPQHELRVRRIDLTIGSARAEDVGVIAGRVTLSTGGPLSGARIVVDDVPEVRTDADGRFTLTHVPVGTRQLEISAIGSTPISQFVSVALRDTATVAVELTKITTLDIVRTTATGRQRDIFRQVEEHRKVGLGYIMDSTAFSGNGTLLSVFASFPRVMVENLSKSALPRYMVTLPITGGRCPANIWIDGQLSNIDDLNMLRPADLGVVEVYPSRFAMPGEYYNPRNECGSVAVWTRFALP